MLRLSICIPTYNRDVYLESLLARIDADIEPYRDSVQVIVSDNASTDRTSEVCARYVSRCVCRRRARNDGPEQNFVELINAAEGEYCWLFGDDEIYLPGAIGTVLRLLDEHSPDLLHVSCENTQFVENPVRFDGLRAYVEYFAQTRPRTLIDITLITTAIFRKALWTSVPDKERLFPTRYIHSFVFAEALCDGGTIAVVPDRVFAVRAQRAPFAEHNLHHDIPLRHLQYLLALSAMTGSRALQRYSRRERIATLWRAPRSLLYQTFAWLRAVARITTAALKSVTAKQSQKRRRDAP